MTYPNRDTWQLTPAAIGTTALPCEVLRGGAMIAQGLLASLLRENAAEPGDEIRTTAMYDAILMAEHDSDAPARALRERAEHLHELTDYLSSALYRGDAEAARKHADRAAQILQALVIDLSPDPAALQKAIDAIDGRVKP